MRLAFYAPLKPPAHPTPSGDRQIARLMMRALSLAGHEVNVASEFRSFDGAGDDEIQKEIEEAGTAAAEDLISQFRAAPQGPPEAWFTYHLYHKAPDWIGPAVTDAFQLPYIVAEASFAPKQAGGPWARGHAQVAHALARVDAMIYLNPIDAACVSRELRPETYEIEIKPFADLSMFADPVQRDIAPEDVTAAHLLAVGMMRAGAKKQSYDVLAEAMESLMDLDWHLTIVGDGPERREVEHLFHAMEDRITWCGAVEPSALPVFYAAADVLVWPGINEALGLSVLEAQAAGTPAVVGGAGALPAIVEDGVTGYVAPEGDAAAFADRVRHLLTHRDDLDAFGGNARRKAQADHSLEAASRQLDEAVRRAVDLRLT